MERIVFPELAVKTYSSKKDLSFKHVLVTVYIFGGVSALMALLSKTILSPLFEQLTQDRRDYSQLATRLLRDLNSKLASQATYVPPVRDVQTQRKYVDDETQTDPDSVGHAFSDANNRSNDHELALSKDLTTSLSEVYDDDETFQLDGMKYAVEELSALVHSLNFSMIRGLGQLAKDKNFGKDHMNETKKEIRSIKGSLLSARNFSSVS